MNSTKYTHENNILFDGSHMNSRSASVQYTEIYLKTESVYAQKFFCVINAAYISGEFLGLFPEN